jgi:diguanylate cyclase (GGDEF)-like protein
MYSTPRSITGIYNRRHFLTLADREWTRSRRYGRPLSLLIFDIDYFKAINDRFGHEVGDQVIVHTTTLVKERKRDTDVLARIGGEEFAFAASRDVTSTGQRRCGPPAREH